MTIAPAILRARAKLIEDGSPGRAVDAKYMRQAADEIERLHDENDELRETAKVAAREMQRTSGNLELLQSKTIQLLKAIESEERKPDPASRAAEPGPPSEALRD